MSQRPSRRTAQAPSAFIDDIAHESDNEGGSVSSELTSLSEDSEGSLRDFIVHRPESVAEDGDRTESDSDMPAPSNLPKNTAMQTEADAAMPDSVSSQAEDALSSAQLPAASLSDDDEDPIKTPAPRPKIKRKRFFGADSNAPAPASDSDEEAASLKAGDKMFSDSRGVKPSVLPAPLQTRSTVKAALEASEPIEVQSSPEGAPAKKPRTAAPSGRSEIPGVSSEVLVVRGSTADTPSTPVRKPRVTAAGEGSRPPPLLARLSALQSQLNLLSRVSASGPTHNAIPKPVDGMQLAMNDYLSTQIPGIAAAVLNVLLPSIREAISGQPAPVAPAATFDPPSESSVPERPVGTKGPVAEASSSRLQDSSLAPSPMETSPGYPNVPGKGKEKLVVPEEFASLSGDPPSTAKSTSAAVAKAMGMRGLAIESSVNATEVNDTTDVEEAGPATHEVPPPSELGSESSASTAPASKAKLIPGLDNFFGSSIKQETTSDNPERIPTDNLFLQDLTEYKANYNPNYPCEVADLDLQDDLLKDSYLGLPPLPDRAVLPAYTRNGSADDTAKGGHLIFSGWSEAIKNCTATTISNAITFDHSGVHINPVRASPALITTRPTRDNSPNLRLNVGNRVAICVTCGMCIVSHIIHTVRTHGPQPREHKYILFMMHNQDWERWSAFMCLCFSQPYLYANITDRAIQVGSIKKPIETTTQSPAQSLPKGSSAMMTPVRPAATQFRSRYALEADNIGNALPHASLPAYDATNRDVDFETDLTNLNAFPHWRGEVPAGAFIVLGYTASTYQTNVVKSGPKEEHVSANLLWVMVCGVPK
ncbi:hypothetical protein B0H16DRAFT_1484344 [Mycena metata]|uniref:Uncharacterized protein n=1 Tax=Mycena metata TaxID=1033252 RepID=A0AAD7GK54_9AGAR|nr:hypothetical protein B0H16DRAFT_1484344 [Mycena metata]